MEFIAKRNGQSNYDIIVNGTVVGHIEKVQEEQERIIPGTVLRYAKGRQVTNYYVSFRTGAFEGDIKGIREAGRYPYRALISAKSAVSATLQGRKLRSS